VLAAAGQLDGVSDAGNRDRGADGEVGAVAELTLETVAPAAHRSSGLAGAGVDRTADDLDDVGEAGDRDRARRVGRGAVTDLAGAVVAPALDRGVGDHGAAVRAGH